MTDEQQEQLRQIRERWARQNMPQTVFTSHCKADIDFLLSLLDSQLKPDCYPDMIAVNKEHAATLMRSACIEKVKAIKDASDLQAVECAAAFNYDGEWKAHLKATATTEIITALRSVTIQEQNNG